MSISNLFEPNDYNLFANSINFGNPANSPFQKYVNTGYENTLTGACFAAPVATSGLYRQLDRVFSLSFDETTAAGTGVASAITLGSPLPNTNMWADLNFPIWVTENSIQVAGTFNIAAGTGIATIYKGFNGTFSGVGVTGFPGFSITYGAFFV